MRKTVRGLVCLALSLTVLGACSPAARYRVKTFFFTGVPAPGQENAANSAAAPQVVLESPVERQLRKRSQRAVVASTFYYHGPFASHHCDLCHATTASKPFRTGVAQTAGKDETINIGPRLAYPIDELCVSCHAEKSPVAARARGLWMHGPVGKGWCTQCHNPHKSTQRFMLQKEGHALCKRCHVESDLLLTPVHAQNPEENCVDCHNPHMGETSTLLRTAFDERQNH